MEKRKKNMVGNVISNKMDKTVVVAVEKIRHHRLYRKAMRRQEKYKVHDENNECRLGDVVRIVETRPLSKEKRWRVAEVITKGDVAEIAPKEIGESEITGQVQE